MTRPVASNAVTAAAVRHGGRSAGLAILCSLLFLTFLDNTIVSVALGGAAALAALVFGVIEGESAGYSTPWVPALFGVSLLAAAAFVWQERRAPRPLLDLRFLRVPQFATANVVAFCSYFATFAIFFFTALYLEEVAGYSGSRSPHTCHWWQRWRSPEPVSAWPWCRSRPQPWPRCRPSARAWRPQRRTPAARSAP